ncbi:PotD/PotF family extracellular solute-binding protein [Haloarchaeobius sp. HME9146]|uniref:ABC transporter substrate-binding protein n=1 Tax=Haloarchaeobius sp. HME9146 TaxID=2978732 RepID=UPI0021C02580|nr:PotD/PotF family extracellular solute-binding protein [Haloarchaeobius sp. HME9146]MCT9095056.1 PotD/PotF family extracellular solute-binding protein [Haloarchaeobius sp. HME9146]
MPRGNKGQHEGETESTPTRRRTFLKSAGAASAASMLGLAGCLGGLTGGGGTTTINIYTWEEYKDFKEQIEDKLDITVEYTIGTSSAKMFSAFNSGQDSQYDVVIPNNNYIPKLQQAGLLAPLQKDAVPNFDNLYGKFKEFANTQFAADGDIYGVPIRFGWYGVSYDSRKIENPEKSYSELWNEENKGDIIMYDNHFKSMSAAALSLGYTEAFEGSKVSLSDSQIEKVKEKLIEQKSLLQGYIAADPTYIKSFRQGNHTIGLSGRNEIVEMWANGDDWPELYVPKEGSLAWFEGAGVSAKSDNKEMAWKVVNEYIGAKTGAELAKVGYSPSCNPSTQEHLSSEQNEMFGKVDPGRLDGFIPFKAVENEEKWVTAWEDVKTA